MIISLLFKFWTYNNKDDCSDFWVLSQNFIDSIVSNTIYIYIVLDTPMGSTISSMALCPAGCYKLDLELQATSKLCRVSSHKGQSLELTGQNRCTQKLRCHAVRAALKQPFCFLRILHLSLPWHLKEIIRIWGRFLLPFVLHSCTKDRDRSI